LQTLCKTIVQATVIAYNVANLPKTLKGIEPLVEEIQKSAAMVDLFFEKVFQPTLDILEKWCEDNPKPTKSNKDAFTCFNYYKDKIRILSQNLIDHRLFFQVMGNATDLKKGTIKEIVSTYLSNVLTILPTNYDEISKEAL
jgi:hypothetical protein